MILIVFCTLFALNDKVQALTDSFYEGDYIPGEYIKKFKNGSGKYEQLRFFRRKSDNQAVYCIELWEALSTNKIIPGYDSEQYHYANMDYSVWERIMLIAYYGYGYANHTDSKWYAITQYMIWKETSPETNLYFTDTLNGNRIEKYEQEINEINSLIQKHADIPSFYNQTYQVNYNEPITIQDTNHVLDRFEIIGDGGVKVSKEGNHITISKNSIGESQILFANNGKKYQSSPIVYIDDNGQNLLAPGNYYPIYMVVNVNLPSTNVIVNKLDWDTQSSIPQGDAKLEGTKIQLLDINHQLISEKTINEDGTLVFENVGYGTYYVKEVEAATGYLLNQEIITLEVNNQTETVNFYNRVIQNEIIMKKYLRNPLTNHKEIEEGAIFSIHNSKNEKVATITTDEKGIAKIVLPYGTYTVKQESGAKNHSYIEDFKIVIKEDNITQTFELYNQELVANIRIINTDNDTKLPILEQGAIFKIKNLDKNQYIQNSQGDDLLLTTNDLGKTVLLTLSSGRYQIEQLTAVAGYYVNKKVFDFEISDEVEFELDENQKKYLEIHIPNIKQKSQIEIEKYIEYYINDQFIRREKDTHIRVPIYALEDIYSKDGIKLYQKDEHIADAILQNGKVISPKLVFGKYYVKNSSDNSIIPVVLDKIENSKIKLLDKVYEYQEIKEETIEVPNTLKNQTITANANLLLLLLGLLIVKREKRYEKN